MGVQWVILKIFRIEIIMCNYVFVRRYARIKRRLRSGS